MIALEIQEVRAFMGKLLLRDTFDRFLVSDVRIRTFTDFRIDGTMYPEFFGDGQSGEAPAEKYAAWPALKPHCLNLIRGKQTPLMFRIVFRLSTPETYRFLSESGLSSSAEDIEGLLMTCSFKDGRLLITGGISLAAFYPDKTLERAWDSFLADFLKHAEIT